MIQGIYYERYIFAHIRIDVILTLEKLGSLVDKVGGKYSVDGTFFVSLFEFLEAVGE